MQEKSPLENLFEQMNELLKLVSDGTKKGIIDSADSGKVEEKLNQLEKQVEEFTKLGEKAVELSGLSSVDLRKYKDGAVKDVAPEGKALIEKAKKLQNLAESLEESYKTGIAPQEEQEKIADDPEYGKHRRKKFKRFGSNDQWKPL